MSSCHVSLVDFSQGGTTGKVSVWRDRRLGFLAMRREDEVIEGQQESWSQARARPEPGQSQAALPGAEEKCV